MGLKARIGRTVTTTYATCLVVGDDNQTHEEIVELLGYYDDNHVLGAVRRKLGNNNVLVEKTTYTSVYASQPVSVFLANCDKITEVKIPNKKEN